MKITRPPDEPQPYSRGAFLFEKGKVKPGKYRAYEYGKPSHRWADRKLKWREIRIRAGIPPAGSSPAEQQKLGLNRD